MTPELERKLRQLGLSGFVQALPVRNQEAITNHLAYVEFLELLVEDELARRRDLLFQRRMKQAQLPPPKYLDEFDLGLQPQGSQAASSSTSPPCASSPNTAVR